MLEGYDDDYQKAEATNGAELPDATYSMLVTDAVIKLTKETQKPMLALSLVVMGGQYDGRKQWRNSVITPESLGFIKSDLKTMGMELEKFSDLEERVSELIGLELDVTVSTKGKFRNLYINRVISAPANEPADVPFD